MIDNHIKPKIFDLCELLLDASIDRVMAVDMNWNIIAWNRASETITGVSKEQILHKPVLEIFPELKNDTEYIEALKKAMQRKKSFLLPNRDFAHRIFYENHIIPLEEEDGTQVGILSLMHDVSHRIKAEQQLQRLNISLKNQYDQLQKANAELAIFTSVTSKDLKEPVKKLYTGLELLVQADGKKLSDNSKANLRRMQASLTKMNLLLDDIMGFSSASSFSENFIELELDEILGKVIAALQLKIADKKAVIEMQHLPAITGSKEMLHYLFYNLLDNALKFQPGGSNPFITITSKIVDADGKPRMLCIEFTDNGIGFGADDYKRIFIMFERLHPRKRYAGAGIGLTISKKIVEAHGGFIEAESNGDGGSVFRCYLPIGV